MHISAIEFKTRCLKLVDEIVATRQAVVLTKHGKPIARIMPIEDESPSTDVFGHMKGTGKIVGDIVDASPEPGLAE